ncbi:MAG: hypothetical protein MMC23_000676 [Stictis urceolatum]|nr:hypothetical protein [Stictis urceolata]
MHYTDPQTGLFHVGFLYSGASGATTGDLVTYTDLNSEGEPFVRAGGKNDPVAVFDGSVIPAGINGTPTLLYTSVSYLPIQWTIKYTKGSETQSLAVSVDGGKNFTKLEQGPVIPGPPFAVNVTGFRDPYVFQNPTFDHAFQSMNGTWYTTISGGVHYQGPSMFLYRQYDAEFRDWEFLGEWWTEPANSTWQNAAGEWAGRWGYNFEVGNVFSLDHDGYNPNGEIFTTLGAEWSEEPIIPQVSQFREMLWAAGNITSHSNGNVKFSPTMAGKLDWGLSAYAAAGKIVPASSKASSGSKAPDRFISYIWLTGNFFGTIDFPIDQQGWDSSLLLPRELSIGTIYNVVDNELVREPGVSWRVANANSSGGTVELTTLKQSIARELLSALTNTTEYAYTELDRVVDGPSSIPFTRLPTSKFYIMTATIEFPQAARNLSDERAGFKILGSQYESTSIYYQFSNESIIIDRSHSSAAANTTNGIQTWNEAGRIRLFDIADGSGQAAIEALSLTIVVDNSIVEVWANDRFVMSTWVWAWYEQSNIIEFLHLGEGSVRFGDVSVYDGLVDAWPDRER